MTVYVCAERDIDCGDSPAGWCLACPKRPRGPAPIGMVLHCPACGLQHVDAATPTWPNDPHRSHLCAGCGHIWRPADVPTNGVAAVKTHGKNDSPLTIRTDLYREYFETYGWAQARAAAQIWGSMAAHDGDPRWSWGRDLEGTIVESLT